MEDLPGGSSLQEGLQGRQRESLSLEVHKLAKQVWGMTEDGEDHVILTPSLEILLFTLQKPPISLYHLSCFGILMVLAEKLAEGRVISTEIGPLCAFLSEQLPQMTGLLQSCQLSGDGEVNSLEYLQWYEE